MCVSVYHIETYIHTTLALWVTKFRDRKTTMYTFFRMGFNGGRNNKFKPNNHPENVFFKYSCEMNYVWQSYCCVCSFRFFRSFILSNGVFCCQIEIFFSENIWRKNWHQRTCFPNIFYVCTATEKNQWKFDEQTTIVVITKTR